jgi:hydroxysqualene synthase
VHGEDDSTWPASDSLCAALQVINHLQDCAKDHRDMDRVYIPSDIFAVHGARVEDLAAPAASPGLRRCIADLAARTRAMVRQSGPLHPQVRDLRLCAETAAIAGLADRLLAMLIHRDPLSERVHLSKTQSLSIVARAAGGAVTSRLLSRLTAKSHAEGAR